MTPDSRSELSGVESYLTGVCCVLLLIVVITTPSNDPGENSIEEEKLPRSTELGAAAPSADKAGAK